MAGEQGDSFEPVDDGARAEMDSPGGGRRVARLGEVGLEGVDERFGTATGALKRAE